MDLGILDNCAGQKFFKRNKFNDQIKKLPKEQGNIRNVKECYK